LGQRMKAWREKRRNQMLHIQSLNRDADHAPVGTCPHMCPEFERFDRELKGDLSVFEIVPGSDEVGGFPRVQHAWAVTKYHRSTANLDAVEVQFLPEDIRPVPILRHTLNWLWQYLDDPKV
jgi:hypothetical protein